uniref:Enhancer of polycomb-like protein n=1 Tax=Arcella intermedia TaxID=1963864 RepID=A0A6B2L1I3_9EUKA
MRSRPLDPSKPLEIVRENLDVEDAVVYREVHGLVPQMLPEEEQEKHLQESLQGGAPIPIPGVNFVQDYETNFPADFQMPHNYITVRERNRQMAEYDADESDEEFIKQIEDFAESDFSIDHFEMLIDTFEKKVELSNLHHFTCKEAVRFVSELLDEKLALFVPQIYNYWKQKRLDLGRSLLVKLPNPFEKKQKGKPVRTKNHPSRKRKNHKKESRKRKSSHLDWGCTDSGPPVQLTKMEEMRDEFLEAKRLLILIQKRELIKLEQLRFNMKLINFLSDQMANYPLVPKSDENGKLSKKRHRTNGHKAEEINDEACPPDYVLPLDKDEQVFDLDVPVQKVRKKQVPPSTITSFFQKSPPFTSISNTLYCESDISEDLENDKANMYFGRRRYGRGGKIWFERISIKRPKLKTDIDIEFNNQSDIDITSSPSLSHHPNETPPVSDGCQSDSISSRLLSSVQQTNGIISNDINLSTNTNMNMSMDVSQTSADCINKLQNNKNVTTRDTNVYRKPFKLSQKWTSCGSGLFNWKGDPSYFPGGLDFKKHKL